MRTLDPAACALLVVDFQSRLMPAIDDAAVILANAQRLLAGAGLLDVPVCLTEQYARGLGGTVAELVAAAHGATLRDIPVLHKMDFDACRAGGLARMPARPDFIVAGCEAHVCVLQTVLGLLDAGRRVHVVLDAIGSRQPASKAAALRRMEHHGAEMVTTEMVLFEWLGSAEHPRFRDVLALVK